MKLVEIWNSRIAWGTLSGLKKNPKLAYRLLKYERLVDAELAACNAISDALVYKAAGVEPPVAPNITIVQLAPGSEQYVRWLSDFGAALEVESDLSWSGVSMDDLIDALAAESGNALSEGQLKALEPFFTEPAKADLKLVESGA